MAAFLFRAIPGQPLAITSAALPAGQVGDAYSATLEASGGTPPYVWSADGLPSGLNIDQPSGVISGTPTEAGTFPVEFTVTDSRGTSVTETLNLVVREPAPGPDPGGEDDSAGGEDDPVNSTRFVGQRSCLFHAATSPWVEVNASRGVLWPWRWMSHSLL